MRTLLILMLVSFAALQLNAQQKKDTVVTLAEVTKEASFPTVVGSNPLTGYKYVASKSLNDVLRETPGIYFKNYGSGQLSSITFRGTSAAQTDLLWNGIKLNSPSLGQIDASLFYIGMSDGIELGGSSQNGNVGGYINMQNETRVDSGFGLSAGVSYGSFNSLRSYGKVNYGDGKFSGTTRMSYFTTDNDYPFKNTSEFGSPTRKLTNAKVRMLSFMQQFNARVNKGNSLHFNLWLSDAQRQIPPIISKPESKESQDDYSLRTMLSWNGKFKNITTNFTSAFLHDAIHYRNPEIYLDDNSIVEAFRNNFSLSYDSLKRFSASLEVGYDYERAMVASYGILRSRHIGKLTAGLKYQPIREVSLHLNLRESIYDKTLSPFSPMLSIRYNKQIYGEHNIAMQLNASRTFRFPTLNDLYWKPGGNPDLKTEKGWDGELSTSYGYKHSFSFKANGFCKYITDWIQWIPNGSYWEPQNVKRVLTRGIELSATAQGPFTSISSAFNLALNLNYTYTRATSLDALSPGDQSKNKQLIYVPLHMANLGVHVEYKKFYLRAINTFTDAVFITTDNSQKLKGYYLLDLEVGKDFVIGNSEIGVAFRVNNITDSSYQAVAQRPMPGRSFEGTLRFKFR
jgi:vitamin B12 transporter